MADIIIKPLAPELIEDYFDFFDNRAFSDGSPYYPCYCNAFNLSLDQIKTDLYAKAKEYSDEQDGWKRALRESAWRMVESGTICGYLAYDKKLAIGWCNANDRLNYYRVGEFDIDNAPEDSVPSYVSNRGYIKSIVCFEISSGYRGQGIARRLLDRVCQDAIKDGYSFVEAYPKDKEKDSNMSFAGPYKLYEQAGFHEYTHDGSTIVMRKSLG